MRLIRQGSLYHGWHSGIGLATAEAIHRGGAEGCDRRAKPGDVAGSGGCTWPQAAAVADRLTRDVKAIDASVEKALSAYGKIDIVFANAGASRRHSHSARRRWTNQRHVETNLTGVFFSQYTESYSSAGGT